MLPATLEIFMTNHKITLLLRQYNFLVHSPSGAEIFYLLSTILDLGEFLSKAKKPTAEEVKKKEAYYAKKEKKASEVKKKK